MSNVKPPTLKQFARPKQRRLDELLSKNSEGCITDAERRRLTSLVDEAERLMVENAKRLAAYAEREGSGIPPDAVPVTVWLTPGHAER